MAMDCIPGHNIYIGGLVVLVSRRRSLCGAAWYDHQKFTADMKRS